MLVKSFLLTISLLFMVGLASGADLYRVMVNSPSEADRLNAAGVEPLVRIPGGYLILADPGVVGPLSDAEIEIKFIASDVSRDQLAVDLRRDRANVDKYPLLFEEGDMRLYRSDVEKAALSDASLSIMPVRNDFMRIEYVAPRETGLTRIDRSLDLQTLIDMISRDSLESYSAHMQAYNGHLAGTASNYAARDWLAAKFDAFGYDSVVVDSFVATVSGLPTQCQNVIAYKVGTVLPDHHVIVGAHRDAVLGSPGADDNSSGTCGVLEIARILKDIETDLTFIFILFDSEEQGLNGAYHYVAEAVARGDSIVYMLNMDMIAHYENSGTAALYHGSKLTYTELWQTLADSLVGINGVLSGGSSGSDHYPFIQNGYEATFAAEYIFSSVYHTYRDSTTYMNYEYMTRMVKASAATAYTVSQTYIPGPMLVFDYPEDIPVFIEAEQNVSFDVNITGSYGGVMVPGSAQIHYSLDGGPYTVAAMTEVAASLYRATLPAAGCGSRYTFYVSAEEDSMGLYYDPAPDEPNEAVVAASVSIAFADDFETDKGWTVTGYVADGPWTRGVPVGGGDRGDPPTDYDGSGSCYLTDNVDDNSDVDGGTTYLNSPTFDLTNREGLVHYARWYSNSFGASPYIDVMKVYISNNNGTDWVLAETVGPLDQASGGWFEHSFWVSHFVAPTNQMKVRFEAADLGEGSVVEAGVDDFVVKAYLCGSGEPPSITTETLPNAMVGIAYAVQLEAEGGFGPKTWSDVMNNLNGTGLSLSSSGLITGSPIYIVPIPFTATVEDALGATGQKFFMIQIGPSFVCGDANRDNEVNVADAVFIINYVFKGGTAPDPVEAGDANCDGQTNVADAVYLIGYVFKGGAAPCCP